MKVIGVIRSIVWRFLGEALLIFLLLFTFNNYTGYSKETITADGMGYYDYLPALFIHHDLPGVAEDGSAVVSERIRSHICYFDYQGKKLDKYPSGTALLIAPFFAVAHSMAASLG